MDGGFWTPTTGYSERQYSSLPSLLNHTTRYREINEYHNIPSSFIRRNKLQVVHKNDEFSFYICIFYFAAKWHNIAQSLNLHHKSQLIPYFTDLSHFFLTIDIHHIGIFSFFYFFIFIVLGIITKCILLAYLCPIFFCDLNSSHPNPHHAWEDHQETKGDGALSALSWA